MSWRTSTFGSAPHQKTLRQRAWWKWVRDACEKAFCPLTADKLMITPDSIPSYTCAPPPSLGIDWVFAAGQTRFTRYARDWKPKDLRLTDHPIVWTRAHMSE